MLRTHRAATALVVAGLAFLVAALATTSAVAGYRGWRSPVRVSTPNEWTNPGGGGFTSTGDTIATWLHGSAYELRVAVRPAGATTFGPDQGLGPQGFFQGLMTDAQGDAAVLFSTQGQLMVSSRAPGGRFAQPVPVADSPRGEAGGAMNASGAGVIAYSGVLDGKRRLVAVRRSLDGSLSAPVAVGDPVDAAYEPSAARVVVGPDGAATILWQEAPMGYDPAKTTHLFASRWAPGQAPSAPQPLAGSNVTVTAAPQVGIDAAGDVVAAWTEQVPGAAVGRLHVAFAHGGGFATSLDTGLDLGQFLEERSLAVTPAGALAIVADTQTPGPGAGSTLGPAVVLRGDAHAGTLSGRTQISDDAADQEPLVTLGPTGDGVAFYSDFQSRELRAVRLPAAGGAGAPEVVSCPGQSSWPRVARVDATGATTLLWTQQESGSGGGLMLSEDRERGAPWPSRCQGSFLQITVDPGPPAVGRPSTFDASAAASIDAEATSYAWDLDGDGAYETDTGYDPKATYTYQQEQNLTVRLRVRNRDAAGAETDTIYEFLVEVAPQGSNPQGLPIHLVPLVPGAPNPYPRPVFKGVAAQAPAPAPVPASLPVVSVLAPATASLRSVVASGLGVHVRAARRSTVRLTLVLPAKAKGRAHAAKATRETVLATRSVAVRSGQDLPLHLRLGAQARRKLPASRRTKVELRYTTGKLRGTKQITLVRR